MTAPLDSKRSGGPPDQDWTLHSESYSTGVSSPPPWPPWGSDRWSSERDSRRVPLAIPPRGSTAEPVYYQATAEARSRGAQSYQLPLKDPSHAQRAAFEQVQTELLLQSRRQDEVFECVAKVEADLSRVAKLTVENEGLHATERHQKHVALANLTRRTEDALLTCESLRKGQEHLIQKVERLEALAEDWERLAEETRGVQKEVDSLQGNVREKLDAFGHALRRLDAMEQVSDENTKLRQELAQLRRAGERRDLEMAAVQGQIDALTKLVREQLREPLSPPKD